MADFYKLVPHSINQPGHLLGIQWKNTNVVVYETLTAACGCCFNFNAGASYWQAIYPKINSNTEQALEH